MEGQGLWVYNRFVNPKTKVKNAIFLPANLNDNPFIDKESYISMLNKLDPITRERLLNGVWEIRRSGKMFKKDWFQVVDELPTYRRKVRFWDIAASEKTKQNKDPDYTSGCLLSESNGIFYIEDFCAFKGRPEEVERQQQSCVLIDGPIPVREEQEPGASGISIISNKAKTIFLGQDYKGVKSTGSKVERANPVSAASERGQIKIYSRCRNISLFFEQASTFPNTGYGFHDDLIDSLSGAFCFLGQLPVYVIPETVNSDNGSYWASSNWSEEEWGGWRS